MKDPFAVLKQKQNELAENRRAVISLMIVIPLLQEEGDVPPESKAEQQRDEFSKARAGINEFR